MSQNVKVTAILTAKPDKEADLRTLLDGLVAASRAEPGNLRYDLWRERADPARLVLDELYADNAAVEAHRATEHFQGYLARINELAERTAIVLDPAAVA